MHSWRGKEKRIRGSTRPPLCGERRRRIRHSRKHATGRSRCRPSEIKTAVVPWIGARRGRTGRALIRETISVRRCPVAQLGSIVGKHRQRPARDERCVIPPGLGQEMARCLRCASCRGLDHQVGRGALRCPIELLDAGDHPGGSQRSAPRSVKPESTCPNEPSSPQNLARPRSRGFPGNSGRLSVQVTTSRCAGVS